MKPLNRRHFLTTAARSVAAIATAAVLGAGLVACGSGTDNATPTGATRTVTDVEGTEVKVPENPQRVVALSEPTLDAVLALGITPVGTISGRGQSTVSSYLLDKAGSVPIMGSVSELNFEAIGNAQPDLIVVDGTSVNNNPPVIESLRKIAPVVYTGYAGGDWRDNLAMVADAVNKKDAAAQVEATYDNTVAEMKAQLGPKYGDATFSIVRWQGNAPSLILKELPAGRVLNDLGLKRPSAQDKEGRGHSEPVSIENLKDIDADYMFFGSLGGSSVGNPNAGGSADTAGSVEALNGATSVQGFTDLTAYKENHIIPVDGAAWTSTGGPLLAQRILSDIKTNLL